MTYLLLFLIIKYKSRLFGLHKEVIHFVGLLKKEKKMTELFAVLFYFKAECWK